MRERLTLNGEEAAQKRKIDFPIERIALGDEKFARCDHEIRVRIIDRERAHLREKVFTKSSSDIRCVVRIEEPSERHVLEHVRRCDQLSPSNGEMELVEAVDLS